MARSACLWFSNMYKFEWHPPIGVPYNYDAYGAITLSMYNHDNEPHVKCNSSMFTGITCDKSLSDSVSMGHMECFETPCGTHLDNSDIYTCLI